MLNLRSPSRKDYFARLVFVALFCLSVHCVVAYVRGARGREMFGVERPEQAKTLLAAAALVAVAAFVIRPGSGKAAEPTAGASEPLPTSAPPPNSSGPTVSTEQPVPAETPAPVVQPVLAETPAPVANPVPVEDSVRNPQSSSKPDEPAVPDVAPAQPAVTVPTEDSPPSEPSEDPQANAMVEKLWETARKIEHNFVPDPIADRRYLSLLHSAALSGHAKAQAKLGEYALRRGFFVESYYWQTLAKLNGMTGIDAKLRECSKRWAVRGCPPEHANVYEFFTDRQSALGRAALRLDSCIQVERAVARLKDMANEGEVVALLILEQHKYRVK